MIVNRYHDPTEFSKITQSSFLKNETANNLILGLSQLLNTDPSRYKDPFMLTVIENGDLLSAALMTPPFPLLIHAEQSNPKVYRELINYCVKEKIHVPGVNGRSEYSDLFAACWSNITHQTVTLTMALRVYELTQGSFPRTPPGKFYLASKEDISIVTKYFYAMQQEAHPDMPHHENSERVLKMIEQDSVFLWKVNDKPVSIALSTRPTGHAICISGVYTPPQERKKGYASACVAHLSQYLLAKGYQSINLFTDLSNPTSNDIYMQIGFRPICDYHRYIFE